jgi:hypothetical protein
MWFALILVILGALMDNLSYVEHLIPPQYYGLLVIAIGVTVAILRFITTDAIGRE